MLYKLEVYTVKLQVGQPRLTDLFTYKFCRLLMIKYVKSISIFVKSTQKRN
jgi:hypothetical protein